MLEGDAQLVLEAMDGVAYMVDAQQRIRAIGRRGWVAFATANDGAEIAEPGAVLGRPLDEFISGEEVRSYYRRVMEDVFSGRRGSVVLPSMCDGPDVHREMRLSIVPLVENDRIRGALFQSTIQEERHRPPIDVYDYRKILAAFEQGRALPIIAMCSLCQRICETGAPPTDAARWLAAEEYYRRGGGSEVRISHTICGDCHGLADQPGMPPR